MNSTDLTSPTPDPTSNPTRKGLPKDPKHGVAAYPQAARIVSKFGGEAALAKALGVHRVTVYRWSYRPPYGSNGIIPTRARLQLEALADMLGLILTPEDWSTTR